MKFVTEVRAYIEEPGIVYKITRIRDDIEFSLWRLTLTSQRMLGSYDTLEEAQQAAEINLEVSKRED